MKVQKILNIISTVLLGTVIIVNSLPLSVIAKDNIGIVENSVRNEELQVIPNTETLNGVVSEENKDRSEQKKEVTDSDKEVEKLVIAEDEAGNTVETDSDKELEKLVIAEDEAGNTVETDSDNELEKLVIAEDETGNSVDRNKSTEQVNINSNGTQKSDWEIEESNDKITLLTYKGKSTDIVIPSEIDGKQVFISGYKTKLSPDVTSVIVSIENGKKVKIEGNLTEFFLDYTKLKNVDLSGLDLSNVTSFNRLFGNCSSLTEIKGLNNLDISNVDNIRYMFHGCTSLKDISFLENWDISNIEEFEGLFEDCESLEDLTPLKNWDTSKVEDFGWMFSGCKSLRNITPLQNWNVSSVTSMISMFRACSSLKYIDLNMWQPVSLRNAEQMFMEIGNNLDILFVNLSQWNLENVSIESIFMQLRDSASKILVVTNDKKLENYHYKVRGMHGNSMLFDASGGNFADGDDFKISTPLYTIPDTTYSTVESIIENIKKEIGIPLKEGNQFNGWSSNVTYINNVIELLNQNFNANWQPIIYNVNFDSQGGSVVVGQTIEFNEMIQEPIPPIKSGFTFQGWYKEADYRTKWNFHIDRMPADNVILYAKWVLNTIELNHVPTINATDKTLIVGDKFNPLDGVTAHDYEDNTITLNDTNIIANNVDTSVAGTYYVTYKVTDSKGASVEKTITVIVKEKPITSNEPDMNEPNGTTKPDMNKPNGTTKPDMNEPNGTTKPDMNKPNGTTKPNMNKPNGTTKPDMNKPNGITKFDKPSGHTNIPQTGDMSNIGLFGFMFAGSIGLFAILFGKKRNKKMDS